MGSTPYQSKQLALSLTNVKLKNKTDPQDFLTSHEHNFENRIFEID